MWIPATEYPRRRRLTKCHVPGKSPATPPLPIFSLPPSCLDRVNELGSAVTQMGNSMKRAEPGMIWSLSNEVNLYCGVSFQFYHPYCLYLMLHQTVLQRWKLRTSSMQRIPPPLFHLLQSMLPSPFSAMIGHLQLFLSNSFRITVC